MAPSARASPALSRHMGDGPTAAVDSPVFRFHDVDDRSFRSAGSDRYATVAPRLQHDPWTSEEHERFLVALEKYGCGQSTSVFAAWHAIASAVATRSVADVQLHAGRYYAQLQAVSAQRRKEYLAMQQIDGRWTRHEDAQLERELAAHIPARVSFPWESIARRVPGKTPRDARERYHKLCYDVSRIEAGQHVMMHLSRQARHGHDRDQAPNQEPGSSHGIDCVVTLTPAETQILLTALEQVPVPGDASPDVLAAVASGVAALACSKHKQPPRRVVPQFSMDEARLALEHAIESQLCDPLDVLDQLASELRLKPQLEPTSTTARTSAARWYETPASSSFAFSEPQDAASLPASSNFRASSFYLQSPVHDFDRDDTRAGEALLTHLKTSPVHNPQRSNHTRRRPQRGGYTRDDADESVAVFPLSAYAPSSFPYSLMPSTASVALANSRYSTSDSDRRSYDFYHHDDDPMDDYL